ncbi:MAG: acetyl-CoA carboxylase biotin carboxyl carrier protein subunit [Ignavibacteriaceae bacterium]|nr:acetyl-CoA carboxylase biotin carboxyl carrier protein subunit [Ignavibacteriaceae bacterium]
MKNKELNKLLIDDTNYETNFPAKFLRRKKYVKADPKKVFAFIPGVITNIKIKPGQTIGQNESIIILEAMKMKNDLLSPLKGKVKDIFISEGQMVTKGQLLIEFE